MKILSQINKQKQELLFSTFVAALSSAGITFLLSYWVDGKQYNLVIGLICISIVIFSCITNFISNKQTLVEAKSVFILNKEGSIPFVFENEFHNKVRDALDICMKENEAYQKRWNDSLNNYKQQMSSETNGIFDKINNSIPKDYTFILELEGKPFVPDASNLLKDAIEYEFLSWLSGILHSFYDNNDICSTFKPITREVASEYIQKNKVLDLLSRDFSDRAAFKDLKISTELLNNIHEICQISTGITYEKFKLLFPDKTILQRDDKNRLVIKNDTFEIIFSCNMDFFNANLPSGFPELIIKQKNENLNVFNVPLKLEINLSCKAMIFNFINMKYRWIDILCDSFKEHYSFDKYCQRIHFDVIKTFAYSTHKSN